MHRRAGRNLSKRVLASPGGRAALFDAFAETMNHVYDVIEVAGAESALDTVEAQEQFKFFIKSARSFLRMMQGVLRDQRDGTSWMLKSHMLEASANVVLGAMSDIVGILHKTGKLPETLEHPFGQSSSRHWLTLRGLDLAALVPMRICNADRGSIGGFLPEAHELRRTCTRVNRSQNQL
jgi:hypothetical protein